MAQTTSDVMDRDELIRRLLRREWESGGRAEALAEAHDQMEILDTSGFVKVVYGKTIDEIHDTLFGQSLAVG